MTTNIIDFMKHYRENLKNNKKEVDNQFSKAFQEISNKLNQSKEEIERISELFYFRKYSLFLNCLFYNNHNTTNDIKTGFLIGFKEEHLDKIEKDVCDVLDKMNRPFIIVDARTKTYLRLSEELTKCYFTSRMEASEEIECQFNRSDKVFIIREFSGANIDSKGAYLRGLIKKREKTKFIDDTHFERIHPDSDLIFIDYANFLQKVWDKIGYYLSVLSYAQGESEFNLDFE